MLRCAFQVGYYQELLLVFVVDVSDCSFGNFRSFILFLDFLDLSSAAIWKIPNTHTLYFCLIASFSLCKSIILEHIKFNNIYAYNYFQEYNFLTNHIQFNNMHQYKNHFLSSTNPKIVNILGYYYSSTHYRPFSMRRRSAETGQLGCCGR